MGDKELLKTQTVRHPGYLLIPKKNGEVRICVNMRMANRTIKRERHPLPTADNLIHTLNRATVFSKVDLCSALASRTSLHITMFATHKGYTRPKIQKLISEQIRELRGSQYQR